MAIAEVIKGNSTVLSGGLSSETYRILDFLDGSLLVLLFLLSTTLNPIVFYHYWKLPSTVPNILYKVLALADFVTNLVRPILLTVAHFRSHDYRDLFLDPGSYHIFGTITTRVGVTLSSASVALLALTRAIKIQWPFHRIKKRHVTIWLVVVATFEFLIVVANLARDFDNLKLFLCSYLCISFEGFDLGVGRKGYQIHGLSKLAILPMALHALLAVCVSLWAIVALTVTIKQSRHFSNKTQPLELEKSGSKGVLSFKKIKEKFKGCGAIVMINTTSLAMVIAVLSLTVRVETSPVFEDDNVPFCQSSYIVSVVITSVIAASNPLILILFNNDVMKRVAFWRGRSRDRSVLSSTHRRAAANVNRTGHRS